MSAGILYMVGTPIGNMQDITLRALDTLKTVQVIAAEDTRVTGKLLERHAIRTPLVSFREENAASIVPRLIERMLGGESVAMVSDAGTPSVSDPGEQLADAAHDAGIVVSPIPGPSALASAVSACGLSGDGIRFHGFLPRSGKTRADRLESISEDPALCVIYESPHRTHQTLCDLDAACANRRGAVFRELTKMHEEIRRAPLAELAQWFSGTIKGEVTIVVEGNGQSSDSVVTDEQLRNLVCAEIAEGKSARDIATRLSQTLGIRKKNVYSLVVEILGNAEEPPQ